MGGQGFVRPCQWDASGTEGGWVRADRGALGVRRCEPVRGLARSGMRLRHVERGVRRVTEYADHFGTRARSSPAARSMTERSPVAWLAVSRNLPSWVTAIPRGP